MNCDQVFCALTRGPFPSGDPEDELVEAHLADCHECWQIAEALRPALEVFQEAVPPVEGRGLPGYWGDARPAEESLVSLSGIGTHTMLAPQRVRLLQGYQKLAPHPSQRGMVRDLLTVVGFVIGVTLSAFALAWLLRLW